MLTHDDALLILDHVAEVKKTHTIQNFTGDGETYRVEMRATVANLVFKDAGIGFTSYGGSPYGGQSRACYEGACECEGPCFDEKDDSDNVEDMFDDLRHGIADAIERDARSSSHRALTYYALLKDTRDRVGSTSPQAFVRDAKPFDQHGQPQEPKPAPT